MLDDDKVKARQAETPVSKLPPLPLSAEAIRLISEKGIENPQSLTFSEIFHLCSAVVAANKR